MRIAILGGTFSPIHYGHLRIAEEVREALGLDKVLFIPAFHPPHKENDSLLSPEKRLNMVRLAIEDNPFFDVSDMEVQKGGRSYSVVTLREIHEEQPETEINFVVGTDSFNEITTWCEYEELFKLTNFVVVPRQGYPVKKVGEVLPVALAKQFCYDSEKGVYANDYGHFIMYMETTLMAISASEIRERVKEDRSLKYLLPPVVEEYIKAERLYK
jgi:nicotinate-nucleotide adenylyltransferase